MEWIDRGNVISWEGRPKRQRREPPRTYWEEYVETDEWYQEKLLEDVPPEELVAACFDSDVDEDEGETGEEELDSTDDDLPYSEKVDEDATSSDDDTISSAASEHASDHDSASETDSEAGEGESGGEGSDAEGEGGSVPQAGADFVVV
tara:strand:+ start:49 stop:492 length:444 start_codon:yes stop_codon:yes gene_type:complete